MASKKPPTAETKSTTPPAAKPPAAKKAAAAPAKKAAADPAAPKKVNPALMKPLQPSKELAAIVGHDPLPRSQVVAKVWEYVKKHKLQDPTNKRQIIADKKLHPVFGKDKVSMFEMSKHIADHLK